MCQKIVALSPGIRILSNPCLSVWSAQNIITTNIRPAVNADSAVDRSNQVAVTGVTTSPSLDKPDLSSTCAGRIFIRSNVTRMADRIIPPSNSSTIEASDILIKHWQNGTTLHGLPAHLQPKTIAEGYAIQAHIERFTKTPLWGWKIAATSIHGQKHINVDRPLAGRILSERVTPYGQKVPLGSNRMCVAEFEFVFRMGRDLMPRSFGVWEVHEVMDACDGLFLGSEIPDSRYEDFVSVGAAQLIADNSCMDRYVLGPEVKDWKQRDLVEHKVRGWIEGQGEVREGKGGNVLGDPRLAMTWIANELSTYGVPLRKGQYVTTGTCMFPLTVKPGDKVVGDYGDLGRLEIEFIDH